MELVIQVLDGVAVAEEVEEALQDHKVVEMDLLLEKLVEQDDLVLQQLFLEDL